MSLSLYCHWCPGGQVTTTLRAFDFPSYRIKELNLSQLVKAPYLGFIPKITITFYNLYNHLRNYSFVVLQELFYSHPKCVLHLHGFLLAFLMEGLPSPHSSLKDGNAQHFKAMKKISLLQSPGASGLQLGLFPLFRPVGPLTHLFTESTNLISMWTPGWSCFCFWNSQQQIIYRLEIPKIMGWFFSFHQKTYISPKVKLRRKTGSQK